MDTDSSLIIAGKRSMWNTGRIKSSANLVVYNGPQLKTFTKYFWKVELPDQDQNKVLNNTIASFETGTMNSKNWQGVWISDNHDLNFKPAPYFRKVFEPLQKLN